MLEPDACLGEEEECGTFSGLLGFYLGEAKPQGRDCKRGEPWGLWVPSYSLFPRTTRFASFPDYLVIQIKKFTFGLDWVPKKLGMVPGTRVVKEKMLEKERTLAYIN